MAAAPAGPICTRESLARDFRSLGIQAGEVLLLHSSLSKLGWVCGGAEAVVLALLDVLENGTLVVPTHTSDNSDPAQWQNPPVPRDWWQIIRDSTPAFDTRTTRTRMMGVVAETVRTWPGALRSAHPQTSFAAVGPHAAALVADHALDCRLGEQSPLAKLEKARARILLLGVGYDACTAFHLAEYRISSAQTPNSFAAMTSQGRAWMTVQDCAIDEDRFDDMGASFDEHHPVIRGKIGAADTRLFPLAGAVAYAREWLPQNRSSP